jgi:hypothetical protein
MKTEGQGVYKYLRRLCSASVLTAGLAITPAALPARRKRLWILMQSLGTQKLFPS